MSVTSQSGDSRLSEQRFVLALRQLLRMDKAMSQAEMASLFEEDGHLGSEMRHLLLDQGRR